MEWKDIEQHWDQIAIHVRARWDRLTDADVHRVAGNRGLLIAKIRERYALSAVDAEKEVEAFKSSFLEGASRR